MNGYTADSAQRLVGHIFSLFSLLSALAYCRAKLLSFSWEGLVVFLLWATRKKGPSSACFSSVADVIIVSCFFHGAAAPTVVFVWRRERSHVPHKQEPSMFCWLYTRERITRRSRGGGKAFSTGARGLFIDHIMYVRIARM